VQDHRQKFSVFKCIGSEEQMRDSEIYKKEVCVARKHYEEKRL